MKINIKLPFFAFALALLFCFIPEVTLAKSAPFTLIPQTGGVYDKLAQSFQKGDFALADIPTYLKYLIEVGMVIAAGLSVLYVIIGGFNYVISPIVEDKEAGKKTITYAILGLTLSILSWVIVNTVLYVITA